MTVDDSQPTPAVPAEAITASRATAAPWQRMARGGGLLDTAGRLRSTVFEETTALAGRTGAINLGQGFPDFPAPQRMLDAAAEALAAGHNQYTPVRGLPALRAAIAQHQRAHYGDELDPQSQVAVTVGATEALTASLLSVVEPGDEVVVFEPHYDLYGAVIRFAGAVAVPVPLLPPTFVPDPDDVRAAFSARTRAVLLNDPHNPTGTVASQEFLEQLVELATEFDAVIITDEVYEHLRFTGTHRPITTMPGAAGRTLTVSSAGKTFSATGWRVGWVSGPEHLVDGAVAVKTYLSHSAATPLQHAVAEAVGFPAEFYERLRADYTQRRDVLVNGLRRAGLNPPEPQGTFFTMVDVSEHYPLAGVHDAASLVRHWAGTAGVVGIPAASFASDANRGLYSDWVRLAFCKDVHVLRQAMASLELSL